MGHGTSKVDSLDKNFAARIDELESNARKLAEQFRTCSTFRPWATPQQFIDNKQDVLHVPALHNPAWDRLELNHKYSEEVMGGPGKAGGTVGDLMALKWQIDFMAVEERAFRLRHASYARCASLMHGRLDGHGKQEHGIFSFFRRGAQELYEAGKAHGAPPPAGELA